MAIKVPCPCGDPSPHVIRGSVGPTEPTSKNKTAPRSVPLADLGFLEGVTLGTRASIEGVWAYGGMKYERLSPGFGSRIGTKRHRNNLSHTHNNNMK